MKNHYSWILTLPLTFSILGCLDSGQNISPTESTALERKEDIVRPWTKPLSEDVYRPLDKPFNGMRASNPLAKGMVLGTSQQYMEWFKMDNAQSYDVAVGSPDWIYHINNNRDIYYWAWKNGHWTAGDPTGGHWVKMPGLPGIT